MMLLKLIKLTRATSAAINIKTKDDTFWKITMMTVMQCVTVPKMLDDTDTGTKYFRYR